MTHQTDERRDPLEALREELASVAPPVEFAARVRQVIDADAAVRGANWLTGWRWVVPAAAAAAIATAVFVQWRPKVEAPQPIIAQGPAHSEARVARVPEPIAPPAEVAQEPRTGSPNSELRTPNSRRVEPVPVRMLQTAGETPFPEVITNQSAVLRELWARVDQNSVLVEAIAATLPDTTPEIVVNPIEVSPIVIKWLGDPSTAPGVLPIIRRVTADTAERSAK